MGAAWGTLVQVLVAANTSAESCGEQVRRSTGRLIAIVASSLSLLLSACGSPAAPLSGTYLDDTMVVGRGPAGQQSRLPTTDPARQRPKHPPHLRSRITSPSYRPRAKVNGLELVQTTMQTAINSLAASLHRKLFPKTRPLARRPSRPAWPSGTTPKKAEKRT